MWREYLFPKSIQEALQMLDSRGGEARVIAGGTDLVLQRKQGECPASVAVDISRIDGLDTIEASGEYILIGALATHGQVAASPLILEQAAVLAQACGKVGGPQTRNVGTLAGNVVNALPAADSAIALLALDAEVEVATLGSTQWLPSNELCLGVGQCSVDSHSQIVTALRFKPLDSRQGSAYERLAKRRSLILPVLAVAAVVTIEDGHYADVRIAMGPVAPVPLRAEIAEAFLSGKPVAEKAIREAAAEAAAVARPRDSVLRGSQEYRQAMVEVLTRRALARATAAAGWRAE
jgi:CO/xanthine dehydrogenase FAD-binding subunit